MQTLSRIAAWMHSFKGALCWACFCLFAMTVALIAKDTVWVIVDAVCVLYWCWIAHRAIKKGNEEDDEGVPLTDDQKRRLREASAALADVINEIEAEVRAEHIAKVLRQREEEHGKEKEEG